MGRTESEHPGWEGCGLRAKELGRAGEHLESYLGRSNSHVRILGLGMAFRLRETGWKSSWWHRRTWWQGRKRTTDLLNAAVCFCPCSLAYRLVGLAASKGLEKKTS